MQDETKIEKCREADLKKLLKKQAEAAAKDQKGREKEEVALKKKFSIQKQASMMERFFKKPKINTFSLESAFLSPSSHLPDKTEGTNDAVTSLMDCILSRIHESDFSNILKSHLAAWREFSHSIQCNKFQNWGIRRTPKISQIKEIKMLGSPSESVTVFKVTNPTANCEPKADNAFWDDTSCDSTPPHCTVDLSHCRSRKKLLLFDKSHDSTPPHCTVDLRHCRRRKSCYSLTRAMIVLHLIVLLITDIVEEEKSCCSLTRATGLHIMALCQGKVMLLVPDVLLRRNQIWTMTLIVMMNGKRRILGKVFPTVIKIR